jgi:hypothetical protein
LFRNRRWRVDLRDEVVRAGGELSYAIVNQGRRRLLAGVGYGFVRRTAFAWRPQHITQAFVTIGLPVWPGERTRALSGDVPEGFRLAVTGSRHRHAAQRRWLPARGRDDWPVNVKISQTFKVSQPSA